MSTPCDEDRTELGRKKNPMCMAMVADMSFGEGREGHLPNTSVLFVNERWTRKVKGVFAVRQTFIPVIPAAGSSFFPFQ